jgi:hypothetical protein
MPKPHCDCMTKSGCDFLIAIRIRFRTNPRAKRHAGSTKNSKLQDRSCSDGAAHRSLGEELANLAIPIRITFHSVDHASQMQLLACRLRVVACDLFPLNGSCSARSAEIGGPGRHAKVHLPELVRHRLLHISLK